MWELSGAQPGVYYAVVEVDDGTDLNCVAFSSVAVVVTACPPPPPEPPSCPTVSVTCPDRATENAPVTFSATVSGGYQQHRTKLQLDRFRRSHN